ncbi:MAG: hypothetical protein IJT95_00025, partial [Abditibacteriota bacterium]|nr:hypothetical protein [Abditibacteriota bacterium]
MKKTIFLAALLTLCCVCGFAQVYGTRLSVAPDSYASAELSGATEYVLTDIAGGDVAPALRTGIKVGYTKESVIVAFDVKDPAMEA